jgi:hypothetical protein
MQLKIFKDGIRKSFRMPLLKKLFWLYFLLLIFEGALRKWIFPHFSAPLLLVRDPVAVWIIWEAYRTHKWPKNWSTITGILTLCLVALCAVQMVFDGNPWFVAIYGLRSYLLPFPVAFIMGENLDAEDLREFGIFILWILLPMTALEVVQYLSPATAFVNAGAYTGAMQIAYAGDHVRASGTFSYDVGPIDLVPLAAAFLLYGLVNERFAKRWLLWATACMVILSIPVIGARTLVYELVGMLGCVALAAMFGVSQMAKTLKVILPIVIAGVLVSFLPVFSQAMGTLQTRFSQASHSEGDTQKVLVSRLLDPLTGDIEDVDFSTHWIGMGIGRGAAAIVVLARGAPSFLAGEGESSRAINEMGPFPGFAFLLFGYGLGLMVFSKALARVHEHEPLALLLAPVMFSTLYMGVLEQPTEQGFMVVCMAFSLAALRLSTSPARLVPVQNDHLARLSSARLRRQALLAQKMTSANNPDSDLS